MTESQLNSQKMTDFITEVNHMIRPYNMQISRGPNESDGKVFYALINNSDNEITRLSHQWTTKEIVFFRKLLAAIINSPNHFITSTKALNIGREDNLSMTAAENLINRWSQQKWIEEITDGSISIGVRSLLEMNVYIRDHFEVEDCFRCKVLCIRGSNCLNCNIKLHFHCADSDFIPNNKCPNCSKEWTRNEVFATNSNRNSIRTDGSSNVNTIDSETEEEENNQPIRPQRAKRSKRK